MTEEEKILLQGLQQLHIAIQEPDRTVDRLLIYLRELLKWSKKMNLIATGSSNREIIEKHFLDSLTLLPLLQDENPENTSLLDVGSGAGFPGLVVKAAIPDLQVTLLEPRQKRVSFLKHMVRTLKLQKVEIVEERLEEKRVPQILAGRQFRYITCRALTDTLSFISMAAPLRDPQGLIICMKGPGGEKELQEFAENSARYNLHHLGTTKFKLPFSHSERQILVFG
jgi:16S rRNA (guanine527-N7)-methyltransferase